jgi:hypothetical protein
MSDVSEYAPVVGEVDVQAVGSDQLDAMGILFERERATRHCWCMAFCASGWQFAGALAWVHGEPVGWCACGPRSRYTAAIKGRSSLLAGRPRYEDEDVWLVA